MARNGPQKTTPRCAAIIRLRDGHHIVGDFFAHLCQFAGQDGSITGPRNGSGFLALPLCLHVGKLGVSALLQGQLDAFHEQIMNFACLVEGDLPQRSMSAFGTKRTWRSRSAMSAIGGKADTGLAFSNVCF